MSQNEKRNIYRGASAIIPYRLQLADGSFQHLSGYRITLKVKNKTTDPATLYTAFATVRAGDDTWADFAIPRGQLDWPGTQFAACIEAENDLTGDFQPDAFWIRLLEHA